MNNPYDIISNNQAYNGWARCYKEMKKYMDAINQIQKAYQNEDFDEVDRDLTVYRVLDGLEDN